MSIEWCRDCKEIRFGNHRCDPGWYVWQPDNGETEDDARTFYGMSPDAAVEKWAAWSDSHSADYDIVGGGEATVHVRLRSQDTDRAEFLRLPTEELIFEVYGESVPSYHAVQRRVQPERTSPRASAAKEQP